MKKSIFLFVFILANFITLRSSAQDNNEKEIRKLLEDQTVSWNQGDLNTFMKGYWKNDSLMFVGKSGVTYGYENTLNNYKNGYSDTTQMGKLRFDIIQIKPLSPEYYYVTGKWFLTRTVGDLSGHYTLLFRRINGKWVIVSDHSS